VAVGSQTSSPIPSCREHRTQPFGGCHQAGDDGALFWQELTGLRAKQASGTTQVTGGKTDIEIFADFF
jgi:hypothetical protein